MRVTQNTNFDTLRETIHRSKSRMENLQKEASTLKKLNTPSDDPVGAAKILEVRTEKVNNDQFFNTAKLAESFLSSTDHVLSDLTEIITRAKEIAISQSSGASSTDETRVGVAEEVKQLFERAVSAANTRIGDRYLLGGYKTESPPVQDNGSYVGDDGEMMVEIARDVFLSMNLPGLEVFNTDPRNSADGKQLWGPVSEEDESASEIREGRGPASLKDGAAHENVNLFDELQNLRISLLTGDLSGIRGTLERFDQIHGNLVTSRAKVGSRIRGLDSTINTAERHNLTNAQLSSALEDADMVRVMNDLAKEETIFRSVLSSGQRLVLPTLMDFLR